MRVIGVFWKRATTTGDQFFTSGCTAGINEDKNEIIDRRCNRSCVSTFLLFSCIWWLLWQTEGLASALTPVLLTFTLFSPLGKTEPTLRTRQDSAGTRGQNPLLERGQGLVSLCGLWYLHPFEPVCVRLWPCVSRLHPGQAGVGAGCFAPADGAVQGPAGPRWEDRLSAEVTAGGRRAHQGRNIPDLYSKKADLPQCTSFGLIRCSHHTVISF